MADKKKKSDNSLAQMDKRVLDRLVQRGTVSRQDVETHMKNLPDLEAQADNIADKVYGQEPR